MNADLRLGTQDTASQNMAQPPASVYGVIDQIRLRPEMYLGELSLTALDHYLHGYQHALWELQLDVWGEPPFRHFSDWVCEQYGLSWPSPMGWCRKILQQTADERAALNAFFVLIDRFRARRRTPIASAVLGPQHTNTGRRTRSVGGSDPLPPPVEIRVVRFDPDDDVYATLIYDVCRQDVERGPIDIEDHYSSFNEAVASFEMEFGLQANEWVVDRR